MEEINVTSDPAYKYVDINFVSTPPSSVKLLSVTPLISDVTSLMEVTMADYCLQSSNLEL